MAIRANITRDDMWFRFERKFYVITVTDAAGNTVNLNASLLTWKIRKNSSTVYLALNSNVGGGLSKSGPNTNLVTITVNPGDYTNLPAGVHYHELWDDTNDAELSFGDVYIHPSRGP